MLLEELLKPLEITQAELAERLARLFGMAAQFQLDVQLAWDL